MEQTEVLAAVERVRVCRDKANDYHERANRPGTDAGDRRILREARNNWSALFDLAVTDSLALGVVWNGTVATLPDGGRVSL